MIKRVSELLEFADKTINETNDLIKIETLTYEPAQLLKELDPIAYRQVVLDIADNYNINLDELEDDEDF